MWIVVLTVTEKNYREKTWSQNQKKLEDTLIGPLDFGWLVSEGFDDDVVDVERTRPGY